MMKTSNRPLSPHLSVYKPQITSALSILHRITGVILSVGSILVLYWLAAIAAGPEAFASANSLLGSWLGKLILFGWTLALFYHLFNGIRHLMWDTGSGFDLPTVYLSGKVAIGAALVMTLLVWIIA